MPARASTLMQPLALFFLSTTRSLCFPAKSGSIPGRGQEGAASPSFHMFAAKPIHRASVCTRKVAACELESVQSGTKGHFRPWKSVWQRGPADEINLKPQH